MPTLSLTGFGTTTACTVTDRCLRENLELSVKRLYARLDEMIGKGYTEQVADIEQVRDVLDHMLAGVVLYPLGSTGWS